MIIAVVLDDHALRTFPGLDAALAGAGALVMRSFKNTPNPALLRRYRGVGVVGGPDKPGLIDRLERATTTLAGVPAPVIGILPRGVAASKDLLGPGVVDLLPAGTQGVAERILLMAQVPVVTGGRGRPPARPDVVQGRSRSSEVDAGVLSRRSCSEPQLPRPRFAGARVGEARVVQLVAMASSTGGVWVAGAMLRDLPPEGRAVVLAQHMDSEFMCFFAQWLGDTSGWPVSVVEDAEPLRAGSVFLPAGGRDLVVEGERVRAIPSCSRFVPSADRLLASAAARGRATVAVVLSGMGADGAKGMAEVMRAGGAGICQEPATSVVASMPESALRAAPAARLAAPEGLAAAVVAAGA